MGLLEDKDKRKLYGWVGYWLRFDKQVGEHGVKSSFACFMISFITPRVGCITISYSLRVSSKGSFDYRDRIFCIIHYAYSFALFIFVSDTGWTGSSAGYLSPSFSNQLRNDAGTAQLRGTARQTLETQHLHPASSTSRKTKGLLRLQPTAVRLIHLVGVMWTATRPAGLLLVGLWFLQGTLAALTGDRACGEVCDLSLAIKTCLGPSQWAVGLTSRSSVSRRCTTLMLKRTSVSSAFFIVVVQR